jgi:hypothetical protein
MKKNIDDLKSRAEEILDKISEPRIPKESKIVKNSKQFGIGLCTGFVICLILLPILGYYPSMTDSILSAIVSGAITLIFTNYTTKD